MIGCEMDGTFFIHGTMVTMKAHIVASVLNRIIKRYRWLFKWATAHGVDYFRVIDRDMIECPFIIDALPGYWLVWMCDTAFDDEDIRVFLSHITTCLKALNAGEVIVKDRRKGAHYISDYHARHKYTIIQEGGLKFRLNLTQYLDVGLFIDHRKTRDYIRGVVQGANVLNLFSYTGSISCYALDGGASHVTAVDLSKRYCEWHKENCDLNAISCSQYTILSQDVMHFLDTTDQYYDFIFCDPPSVSVTKHRRVADFYVQKNGPELIQRCMNRLTPNGRLIFSTNYRAYTMAEIEKSGGMLVRELTRQMTSRDFDKKWRSRCWEIRTAS